ncbi:MAG: PaaI family thioesterase [candidate division NC10 bacterium]|nr:PaaI family thioesterase [candidate division NC10 bacterium]
MSLPKEDDFYPLEQVRQVFESLPHFRELGITLVELTRGSCTARLDPAPRLAGNPETGALHGGVITTLLDSVGGAAAFASVRQGQTVATLDLRIDYLRASEPGRAIFGRAECYRLSRSVAFVRGTAYCEEAEPLAHCAATFMVGSIGFSL